MNKAGDFNQAGPGGESSRLKSLRLIRLAVVVLASLLLVRILPGKCLAEEETNLEKINQQVGEQESRLREISLKQEDLGRALARQQGEVVKLRSREKSLQEELAAAEKSRNEAERAIADNQKRMTELKDLSQRRLRALYMYRPAHLLEAFFSSGRADSLARGAFFLKKIDAFDRAILADLIALIAQTVEKRKELDALLRRKEQLLKSLSGQKQALEKKLRELEGTSREMEAQKNQMAEALTALKAQALRLETVMVSMTGGAEPEREGQEKKSEGSAEAVRSEGEKFSGSGLFRQKGALVLPVKGKVLQSYGRQKAEQFEDFVFSKGVEYSCAADSGVNAIARGKIMHVGRMPGYGTIVIVDHGERYYSLYGRLGEVRVSRGDIVEQGQIIAETGTPGKGGRNFYFEIRRGGSPVNPLDYFKRL